ncbi:MAG: 2-methylaconitate cis-trans isomerase PrpF [Burkholderiales bacterium]
MAAGILCAPQRALAACYMRGGTSKGLFFEPRELPYEPAVRDAVLLRSIGSPDPYARQIDGMGGATSSTSKVVLVSRTGRPGFDVDYMFGAVSIGRPLIDWSGNCGNLSAAVGPFALMRGLVKDAPKNGMATVRIWQANIGKPITALVPMANGHVVEDGEFFLDGVAFGCAEIRLEFHDLAGGAGAPLLPTGLALETLAVPGVGKVEVSCVDAGIPMVLLRADRLGLSGCELPAQLNAQPDLLARFEAIRAHAAVRMKLVASANLATATRPATPKIAVLAAPARHACSDETVLEAQDIDLVVRVLSMGAVHHAVPGTAMIAMAVAAALPGTVAHQLARPNASRSGEGGSSIRLGHPSGRATVSAKVRRSDDCWIADSATLSRSARLLMRGEVLVPERVWHVAGAPPLAAG